MLEENGDEIHILALRLADKDVSDFKTVVTFP
jgi:hypothetical protein